jgi:excisionase family DNA binding protein
VSSYWGGDLPAAPGLLTPAEAAALCGVGPKTVAHWARHGILPSVMTPGGTRRYRETDVRALLEAARQKYEG